MFVNIAFLARFGIGHDAARHGSGYLSCHNLHAFRSFYYYGGTLVVGAGFGQPGFHELPVFVPHLLYRTIYRIPVGVYINQTHEYRYHDTAVVEVFVFLHFFHHYDFTVGRSYHDFLRFLSEQTDGAAEEVHEYAIYYEADDRYYVKRNFAFQSEVKGSVDSQNQNQAACQCMCSFTVYAYLF